MSDQQRSDYVPPRIRRAGLCTAFAADVMAVPGVAPDPLTAAAAAAALHVAESDLATLAPKLCGLTDTGRRVELDEPAASGVVVDVPIPGMP